MIRLAMLSMIVALPLAARAQGEDAKALAREILARGAARFDERDAAAMAATYANDARLALVSKDKDTGRYKVDVKEGRDAIEALYRDVFNAFKEKTTSRNTVDHARLVAPDLLLIEGVFEPNVDNGTKYAFVQERTREGNDWRITALRLYLIPLEG